MEVDRLGGDTADIRVLIDVKDFFLIICPGIGLRAKPDQRSNIVHFLFKRPDPLTPHELWVDTSLLKSFLYALLWILFQYLKNQFRRHEEAVSLDFEIPRFKKLYLVFLFRFLRRLAAVTVFSVGWLPVSFEAGHLLQYKPISDNFRVYPFV